jgi:excisionase family DNA binding protein
MTHDKTSHRNGRADQGSDKSHGKTAEPRPDFLVHQVHGPANGVSLDEPLLTADAVAELLALAPSSVYYLKDNGDLPYVQLGKRIRFSKPDIERYLASCRRGPGGER